MVQACQSASVQEQKNATTHFLLWVLVVLGNQNNKWNIISSNILKKANPALVLHVFIHLLRPKTTKQTSLYTHHSGIGVPKEVGCQATSKDIRANQHTSGSQFRSIQDLDGQWTSVNCLAIGPYKQHTLHKTHLPIS